MKEKKADANDDHDLEILKAVAQAWHNRSGSSRATNELEAHRQSYKTKPPPTRFRLEAINRSLLNEKWDFRESLWDSYEIVAVSKRLEAGMVLLDDPFRGSGRARVRGRESNNSLRNLFNIMSSKSFDDS